MRRFVVTVLVGALVAACGSSPDVAAPAPTTSSPQRDAVTTSALDASGTELPQADPTAPTAATAPRRSVSPTTGRAGTPTPAPAPARAAAGCPAPPAAASPRADRPRYTLDVDVRPAENVVRGRVAVRFTPDRDTDRIVFRLWPNGPRGARAGARLDIGTLRVDGRTIPAAVENPTTLVGRPEGGLRAGTAVDITLPWSLRLPGATSDRISRNGDAIRLGSFFPILSWEPGIGWATEPPTGAFAEASMVPTADFDLGVTLPPGLTALATGAYAGGRWRATAVRDVALSVGRFAFAGRTVHAPGPVEVTVGVHAGVQESPASYLDKVSRAIEDFSRRFGAYPWPTYTLAITPGLSGGIEYPMHVMQGPGTGGRTTSHEVAHMWFYGLVGNNQGRDPWLDEGVATYAEARFEGTLASMRSTSIPADARGRAGEPMTFWESRQRSYYRGVYVQGAQALAALGNPDLVDCALRHFAARSAHRVARNGDLITAAEAVFPDARAVLARYGIRG